MLSVVFRRIALAVPTLFGVSVVVFLIMQVLPGDPVASFVGEDTTEAERDAMRAELGLDRPLPVRYIDWLTAALQGDLGYSMQRRRDVLDLLTQAIGNTMVLALVSAVFGIAAGVAIGFVAGIRRGSILDRTVSVVSLSGLSIPSFFLAIVLLAVFSGGLKWFPSGGAVLDEGLVTALRHLTLPVLAGSLVTMAITARVTRASVIDVYNSDFIETLRAKGLSTGRINRHVLRNSISPVLTTSGVQIGALLGGSVLVETIFRWPGMGMLVFNAISSRDLLVVQGATLVIALCFVLINLAVDLAQAAIDPRVRAGVA